MVNTQVETLQAELAALKQHIKTVETQLAAQEQEALRFRALFEQSNDAIFLLDLDGVHFACNHRAADMLGYASPDDLIGMSFRAVVHPDAHADSETKLQQMIDGIKIPPYERMFRTRDGELLPVEVNVELIRDADGKVAYIQSIVRDISERKRADHALRASEQRYRQMFERNEAVKLLINPDTGALVDVNPAAVRFYGYDRDTLRQMKITDLNILPPEQVADEMRHARTQERNFFRFKHRLASGDIRDVEVTSCPIDGEDGVLLYSIITDVTDRNQALSLLQASELRYRQLFEDVPVALWEEDFSAVKTIIDRLRAAGVTDFDAYFAAHPDVLDDCARNVVILNVNRAALDMFGEPDKQLVIGKTLHDTMAEVGYGAFKIELLDIISGEPKTQIETPFSTASTLHGHASLGWTIAPGSEDTWDRVLVSITDITDLKRTQDALRQSETRFRELFEHVPVALWEEDFSGAKVILDGLKARGIEDFDTYFDTHPDVLRNCARQVRVLDVNHAALNLYGVGGKAGVVGTTLFDTMSDDGYDPFKQELIALLNNEMTMRLETTVRTVDDEIGYASLGWSIAPGSEDTWDRVLVSITDITDLKRTQDALRQSETRFRQLFEDVPVAVWQEDFSGVKSIVDDLKTQGVTDFDTYFTDHPDVLEACARKIVIRDGNRVAMKMFGTDDKAAVIGKTLYETMAHEGLGTFQQELVDIIEGKPSVYLETPIRDIRGHIGYGNLNWTIAPGSEDTWERILVSITDITAIKQAQGALQTSETRYRGLFENVPIGLWEEDFSGAKAIIDNLKARGVTDFDSYFDANPEALRDCARAITIVDVNRAALRQYQTEDRDVVVGMRLIETLPDEALDRFKYELVALANEQDYVRLELPTGTSSGEVRYGRLELSIAPGSETTWERMLVSITDITDLQQMQDALVASEARYRMLFHIAPVVLLIEDFSYVKTRIDALTAAGVTHPRQYVMTHPEFIRECAAHVPVIEANSRAVEVFGAQNVSELERPVSEVFVDANYGTFTHELVSLAEGHYDYQLETMLRRFDGEMREIWLRRIVLPGAEEDWARVLIMMIDITERKAREQHRIDLGIERERVGMLQQFISGASHDIRTPLATMTTSLYLLEHGGDDPKRRQRHVQTLEQQVKALNRIIDDMLVMSRMDDSSQMTFAYVHVESVIRAILDQYNADIEAKGHTIHIDIAPNLAPIRAADSYFIRALGSVLTNAIEYTPNEGTIHIRVTGQDTDIIIAVQDTGIGIAPDILPHIFDPFYRGDKARQTGHGHTGMGLTLARKIINLHHGTIEVQSEPEVGSTVTIRVPIVPAALR